MNTMPYILFQFSVNANTVDSNSMDEDLLSFLDGVDIESLIEEALRTLSKGEDFTAYLRKKSEDALEHFLVSSYLIIISTMYSNR